MRSFCAVSLALYLALGLASVPLAALAGDDGGASSVYAVLPAPSAPASSASSSTGQDNAASPSVSDEPNSGRSRPSRRESILQQDAKKAAAIRPLIERHAATHGIPVALADAVVRVESRYNPGARNGPNVGLTQINPLTARSLGYSGSASGLLDPDTNLYYGIKYLAGAYKLAGGNTCGTILRYQAGHRATRMTGAAQSYCARVKTIMASR